VGPDDTITSATLVVVRSSASGINPLGPSWTSDAGPGPAKVHFDMGTPIGATPSLVTSDYQARASVPDFCSGYRLTGSTFEMPLHQYAIDALSRGDMPNQFRVTLNVKVATAWALFMCTTRRTHCAIRHLPLKSRAYLASSHCCVLCRVPACCVCLLVCPHVCSQRTEFHELERCLPTAIWQVRIECRALLRCPSVPPCLRASVPPCLRASVPPCLRPSCEARPVGFIVVLCAQRHPSVLRQRDRL
jgi:hypothetical protein